MKRGRLTNRELDELGKRLVVSSAPGEGDIERLVSKPNLYDGVLAKIAAVQEPVREPRKRVALKPVAVMAMAVVLLSIPILALLKYTGFNEPVLTSKRPRPVEINEESITPPVAKPQPAEKDDAEAPRPIHAVMTKVEPRNRPKAPRSRPVRRLPEPNPVFHPIGLADRAEEAAIDGRVVRVEMPRSALFALGMDLPLENGTRAIKADLLVGADGIPKGIRLVE